MFIALALAAALVKEPKVIPSKPDELVCVVNYYREEETGHSLDFIELYSNKVDCELRAMAVMADDNKDYKGISCHSLLISNSKDVNSPIGDDEPEK